MVLTIYLLFFRSWKPVNSLHVSTKICNVLTFQQLKICDAEYKYRDMFSVEIGLDQLHVLFHILD